MKILILLMAIAALTACDKGKGCTQKYSNMASVENRSSSDLNIEVTYMEYSEKGSKPSKVDLTLERNQSATDLKLSEHSVRKEGSAKRGGGTGSNATCTDNAQDVQVTAYLSKKSFHLAKHCLDDSSNHSIFIDKYATCPVGTVEQVKPI